MTKPPKVSLLLPLLLCLSATTLTQQQQQQQQQEQQEEEQPAPPPPPSNPFLARQRHFRQQQQHQMELQKLQQQHLGDSSDPQDPPSQSVSQSEPEPFLSDRGQSKAAKKARWQQEEDQGVSENNRNEMHQWKVQGGGRRPTPWTRWTPRPPQKDNPWQGYQGNNAKTATCGGRTYNVRNRICCQNRLHERQGLRPACCGNQALDLVFNLCCEGNVVARTTRRPMC